MGSKQQRQRREQCSSSAIGIAEPARRLFCLLLSLSLSAADFPRLLPLTRAARENDMGDDLAGEIAGDIATNG